MVVVPGITARDAPERAPRSSARRRAAGMSGASSASRARSFSSKAALRPRVAPVGSWADDVVPPVPGASESAGPTVPIPVAVTSSETLRDDVSALKGMRTYSAPPLTQSDGVVIDVTAPTAIDVAGRVPHAPLDGGPLPPSPPQAEADRAATMSAAARVQPPRRSIGRRPTKRPASLALPGERLIAILRLGRSTYSGWGRELYAKLIPPRSGWI